MNWRRRDEEVGLIVNCANVRYKPGPAVVPLPLTIIAVIDCDEDVTRTPPQDCGL